MSVSSASELPSVASARSVFPVIGLCLALLSSCKPARQMVPAAGAGRITQVSVINALMVGRYDGVLPIHELVRYGDFGVGTVDHLDESCPA